MINKLKRIVEGNCISKVENITTLAYWSDVVFAKIVFILAPLSLLAIVPAIVICLQIENYFILWFDVFCLLILVFVGYVPLLSVKTRKILLILLLFLTAFVLLIELGNFGPGLAYLLSGTILSLLLFPSKKTFAPFILTLILCVIYGFLIHYDFVEIQANHENHVMEWIAVSSNVWFMSAVFSLIIPFFFSKLEGILGEKNHLLESVHKTNLELEKSIEEVKSKNLELEQFAYVASHDLQEPLRMITSFMDKLKRKYADQLEDKALQYIHFATDGAKWMKQIILDLLLYSGVNKPVGKPEPLNLNEIVDEYTQLRRKVIAEKIASITFDGLPILQTMRVPMTQVIHSLLDNALKYVKENVPPRIEILAKEKETLWEFAVKDNGIGIDEKFHDKIFVIFQRLHNRKKYDGTGIGLSIAKRSVEFLGGEIWLESKVGEGTTFYFTIAKNK
ncbi:ATP-binding protein [Algoriphagus sp. D3-2-R+10]|uniref:sensor histidine kinase n=1 Tax=Algoriphagus aurantiacus TaxID=3103948 RepID=UPI002B3A286A|nr:ATP-binding protein [Algoriphagus sp. D3-2-R+10]MEB2778300.1 ATP-binding protein [Algoriphagus sp. D3-2-R+10]